MSPIRTILLGALLLGAPAVAQQAGQPPQAQTPAPAKQEYDELAKAYAAAQREWSAARNKAVEQAKADGTPAPAMNAAELRAPWLEKFRAGAAKYAGTDAAIPYLVWLGGNTTGEERDAIVAKLMKDHVASPEFGGALRLITALGSSGVTAARLGGAPAGDADPAKQKAEAEAAKARVRDLLAQVIEKNPVADVQAKALLTRANLVLQARGEVAPADRDAALADVRKAGKLATDKDVAGQCEGILFEADKLAIGMVAPEIEGKDLDGAAMKLSEFRGKVVLLDYWGYW